MPIVIQPYREVHEQAVRDFNQRLINAGADPNLVFFTVSEPRWLPKTDGANLFQEYFVALDGGIVRGGYALKYQDFYFGDGEVRRIGYYHHPISEGIVNTTYAALGAMLLKDAMNRSPLLYCLGMGGYDRPLPRMLIRLGWAHCAVPFYFQIVKPNRFLREMQTLRTSTFRTFLLDAAALTGTGWLGLKAVQTWRKLQRTKPAAYQAESVSEFSDWADALWERAKKNCVMVAVRNSATLRTLYPPEQEHLRRLRVRRGTEDIGWAVVGERLKSSKYGAMRVGSIIDCWAEPENAPAVVHAAAEALADVGMDLILTNQSHEIWSRAFEEAGFWKSESNFIFAAGKGLTGHLQPFSERQKRVHFTRADGDGLPHNF
jgi:hypothetical protein